MPNNIAEGSGSRSDRDFAHFLNVARRSTFENASMILVFSRRGLLDAEDRNRLLGELESLCRKLTAFTERLE